MKSRLFTRLSILGLGAVTLFGVGCEMHPPAPGKDQAKDKAKETSASKSEGKASPDATPVGETPRFFPPSE